MDQFVALKNETDDAGNPAGGWTEGLGIAIRWQNGPLGTGATRQDPNGAFVEGVIKAALFRLEFYQASKFACEENAAAIVNLKAALESLESRTAKRVQRGVEGTHTV